ncbi:tyrosine-type recombinase/integrase [Limimaricola soesokkakensis]|nr:site-specific integrase [Limimaricola soesokkakensis]
MPKLTARKVASLRDAGMYSDGDGLYLRIGTKGGKSWILRTVIHGKRRDLGLGSVKTKTLAEAREEAYALRKVAREGGDPATARQREALTFEEAALNVWEQLKPTWHGPAHAQRWKSSLDMYVFPHFGSRPIHTIQSSDVLGVLAPIWVAKNDTARRVKQRVNQVFDWAKGAGHYPSENPTVGVEKSLPRVKAKPKHHPALPWQELPAFMAELKQMEGVSARCLELIILTGLRSNEGRGARWEEFSGDVWTVPASRMKIKDEVHRIPLASEAKAIVGQMAGYDDVLVFPSPQKSKSGLAKPLSDTVFESLYERMGRTGFTTHGFRSTFRDWSSEYAHADREIAEMVLAHAVGGPVERAYARSTLFDRRRDLMLRWARFATGKETGKVVALA